MKKILLILALMLLGTGAYAQTFRTPNLTGNVSDFTNEESYNAPDASAIRYSIAYDANNIYFSVINTGGDFGGAADAFTIFIDTDPNGTNGTSAGNSFNNVTPTLPFNADVAIRVEQNYNERRTWDGSQWGNYVSNFTATVGGNHRQFVLAKSDIGNPDFIRFTMWMGYDNGHFAEVPADLNANDNNFTQYFGTVALNRTGSNPAKVLNTNDTFATASSGTVAGGTYTHLELSGDVILGGDITIAAGGTLELSGGVQTINGGGNDITFNSYAGIITNNTAAAQFTNTGMVTFDSGGVGAENATTAGQLAQFTGDVTINGAIYPYQLRVDGTTLLNTNGRFRESEIFYGSSGTLHLNTDDANITNVWSSSDVSGAAGVPQNVIIDQDYNLDSNKTVLGNLRVDSGTLNLNSNELRFLSGPANTSFLGTVANGASITGDGVYAERFIPKRSDDERAFRLITSPVDGNTVREAIQNNGTAVAGYDTQITGGAAVDGFDQSPTNNPSLFTYDNSGAAWQAVTNTINQSFNAGQPYRLFVRGDRSIDLTQAAPAAVDTRLRATGSVLTGDVTFNSASTRNPLSNAAGAFNFIGNPYLAPVDMAAVLSSATDVNPNAFYVWDPTVNARGAYVTVFTDPASPGTIGTNNNTNSTANQYLQPWQAVFIQNSNSATAASITFTEGDKHTTTQNITVFNANNVAGRLGIQLVGPQGNTLDGLFIDLDPAHNAAVDDRDIQKLPNLDESMAVAQAGGLFTLWKDVTPVDGTIIPLNITNYRKTQYTFDITSLPSLTDFEVVLVDQFTNTTTPLQAGQQVAFTVDAAQAGSTAADRFYLQFNNTTLSMNDDFYLQKISMYPNPVTSGVFFLQLPQEVPATIELYNLVGQRVHAAVTSGSSQVNLPILPEGVYILKVNTSYGLKSIKVQVK